MVVVFDSDDDYDVRTVMVVVRIFDSAVNETDVYCLYFLAVKVSDRTVERKSAVSAWEVANDFWSGHDICLDTSCHHTEVVRSVC